MKPMLASKWEARNEDMFPFIAQPKLDGIRVIVGDDGYAYTRSLKPIRSEYIQDQIRDNADLLRRMDGEIIIGDATAVDAYRRTSSAAMSFNNPDAENFTFHIFDRWDINKDYQNRLDDILTIMVEHGKPSFVNIVTSRILHNMAMLKDYEACRVEEGHEGVILRKPDTLYKQGRGTPSQGQLIKLKRFDDTEGEIIAVHELLHNANPGVRNKLGYLEHSGHQDNLLPMNRLGAFEVRLDPAKWQSESVRIGTGLTDHMRTFMWRDRENLIGKVIKYKYFSIGVKDAPRFPVFLGFRDSEDMS